MKEKIARVSLTVYGVLLVSSGFLLCTPGGRVPWLLIMGVFAIPPLVAGPRRFRIWGSIALLLAVTLTTADHISGKRFTARMERVRMQSEQQQKQQSGEPAGGADGSPAAGEPSAHP